MGLVVVSFFLKFYFYYLHIREEVVINPPKILAKCFLFLLFFDIVILKLLLVRIA